MRDRAAWLLDALDGALTRSGGGTELELAALFRRGGTTRFADSRVTQTGDVEELIVEARARVSGRIGTARAGALDADALGRAIADARALAAAQVASSRAFAEPPPSLDDGRTRAPSQPGAWDEATARADAGARAELIAPAFRRAAHAGLTAAGLAATLDGAVAVANTAGARRAHRLTAAKLDVIAQAKGASARLGRVATTLGAVAADADALAADAIARARASRDPLALEPGAYDVILAPAALAELLEWLALTAFGARTVEDGSSFLAGRAGEPVTGPITIYDDARAGEEGCPTEPFDVEATPTRRVVLVAEGRAGSPVHDRASAARAGVEPTGHAVPVGDEVFDAGPVPRHLHLLPGEDDEAALLSRVERGLWVSRFHYVNGLLDTRRALMTGMTRDGLFLVENGRRTRAVRNLRFTESILEAFSRLGGMTRARELVASSMGDAVFVCPSVLVRGWHFTGQSR